MESTAQSFGRNSGFEAIEEEVEELPKEDKLSDKLLNASICRTVDGEVFEGIVDDIEIGKQTKERLYRIRYSDGDLEHLVREEVLECMVPYANRAPKLDQATPGIDKEDAEEQTNTVEPSTSTVPKQTQSSPKKKAKDIAKKPAVAGVMPSKTIKDIAKTSVTTPSKKNAGAPSTAKAGAKPPKASPVIKKPARR